MWIADEWKDYKVLDCSEGEKLESWGGYKLLRPDPQVIWATGKNPKIWKKLNAHYHRSAKGGGEWEFFDLPEQWNISYKDLTFNLKPFSFKHTGLFPEQAVNWDWMRDRLSAALKKNPDRTLNVLNLFAYTGGATVACAKAGETGMGKQQKYQNDGDGIPGEKYRVNVTHVDASKGMVGWAKENAVISGLGDAPIRYIVDDCKKFVEREIRRGNKYDAIIMDPPSYGRGPKGEIWKLEESLYPFVELCCELLSNNAEFVLINSYTTGLQPAVLAYLLGSIVVPGHPGKVEADEIGLPVEASGLNLPCGASGRWYRE
ncbi:MAG: class I SAM-dependent methyltransferase [Lachnospiraceae bacterium]|nr:class I SAM-dependent methyltransferase [Lachnospiraceae bacterium]